MGRHHGLNARLQHRKKGFNTYQELIVAEAKKKKVNAKQRFFCTKMLISSISIRGVTYIAGIIYKKSVVNI